MYKPNKDWYSLVIIIILTIAFYLPMIYLFPFFKNDDFLIFSLIQNHPSDVISLNPNEIFFLFLRPITYFTFWIDFKMFSIHSYLMKLHSLLYLIILQISFYLLLKSILKIYRRQYNAVYLILTILILSVHPTILKGVMLINVRNEILVTLFYLISLLMIVYYLNFKKDIFLFIYILFFLFSILSKQQSLHLPLLVIFIMLLFKDFIPSIQREKIIIYSLIGLLIAIFYSTLNLVFYYSDEGFSWIFNSWWKKPFSMVGTLTIIIIPLWGKYIYEFFLLNKNIALFISLVLMIIAFLFRKFLNIKFKIVVQIIIFTLIIFFPRIMVAGNVEINNSILLFWIFFLISLWLLINPFKKRYKIIILILLLGINFVSSIKTFQYEKQLNEFNNYQLTLLKNDILTEDNQYLILAGFDPQILPFEIYFNEHEKFSTKDKLKATNIGYVFNFTTNQEFLTEINKPHIDISIDKEIIRVKALSKNVLLHSFKNYPNTIEFEMTNSRLSKIRDYDYIEFKINDKIINDKLKLIYFNGIKWIHLN